MSRLSDHSYCDSPCLATSCDISSQSCDLLVDHTYALPVTSDWDDCFADESSWNSVLNSGLYSTGAEPEVDKDVLTSAADRSSSVDRWFSRVELRICDDVDHRRLVSAVESHPSVRLLDERTITGPASAVLDFLDHVCPLQPSGVTSFISPNACTATDVQTAHVPPSPLHVTVVKDDSSGNSPRLRNNHPVLENKSPTYRCPHCPSTFSRKFAISEHIRMIHEKNPRYKCVYCGHGFKRPALLRDHVYSKHTKTHRFVCSMCPKGFIRRRDFIHHRLLCHKIGGSTT